MPRLVPAKLPRRYPRRYVSPNRDLSLWDSVENLLAELKNRVVASAAELARWLSDFHETLDALEEEGAIRYVNMTCQTDDPEVERAFVEFLTGVQEPAKPYLHALHRKYRNHPHRRGLDASYLRVYDRSVETQVALFREANVPLETREERLSQDYQKLSGSLTVEYDGRTRTLSEMTRFLDVPSRAKREEAWRLTAARRLREKDRFEEIFDRLTEVRMRIAENAGFPDYRDYMFRKKERFDYSPQDCERFHAAVEETVVPRLRRAQERKARRLGLPALRPWDVSADPLGLPPLRPFYGTEGLAAAVEDMLGRVHPEFAENFSTMRRHKLLDLDSRPGKAPGGYNTTLPETRLPFIFMNAAGTDDDVRTLLHEAGHAMHTFAVRDLAFSPYRHAPMEFCEVASMGMELLASPHLSRAYPNPRDAARSRLRHLEGILALLPWVAQVDAFQHWIYRNPGHSRKDRAVKWTELSERFGGAVDWSGLDEERSASWHRQLHIFEVPFYYIEYGIAQLGALQVWRNARRDYAQAVQSYRAGLALGGSRPLPELFAAAGLSFGFDGSLLAPLVEEVEREMELLEAELL